MSDRKFRLATVLRVRKIQEEMARGEVAKARLDVTAAEQEAARQEAAASGGALPSGANPRTYLAAVNSRLGLAADAAAARAAVAEVEAVAEEKHQDWKAAAAKVKPLERLEESHRDARRAADDRAAQAANDELAGARHETNRRAADKSAARRSAGLDSDRF